MTDAPGSDSVLYQVDSDLDSDSKADEHASYEHCHQSRRHYSYPNFLRIFCTSLKAGRFGRQNELPS